MEVDKTAPVPAFHRWEQIHKDASAIYAPFKFQTRLYENFQTKVVSMQRWIQCFFFLWNKLGRRNVAVIVLHTRRRKDDDPFAWIVRWCEETSQKRIHLKKKNNTFRSTANTHSHLHIYTSTPLSTTRHGYRVAFVRLLCVCLWEWTESKVVQPNTSHFQLSHRTRSSIV